MTEVFREVQIPLITGIQIPLSISDSVKVQEVKVEPLIRREWVEDIGSRTIWNRYFKLWKGPKPQLL